MAGHDWCNGNTGLTKTAWLAILQWFIAAIQLPHLATIAPREGLTDLFRYDIAWGRIPNTCFNENILSILYSSNRTEGIPAMLDKYPLMNAYREDKVAKLEKIRVPAYVIASYSNPFLVYGTFEGFRRISSKSKMAAGPAYNWVG